MKHVYWDRFHQSWKAQIKIAGKTHYGGRSKCLLMAAIFAARLREELEL